MSLNFSDGGYYNQPTFNIQDAFCAIALCAVLSDGEFKQNEINAMAMNLARLKLFKNYKPDFKKIHNLMIHYGINNIIRLASSSLPIELRESAFAFAVDMVLADGFLAHNERNFLTKLYEGLGISQDVASKIFQVMEIKNRA